jgi:hypothetical protein
MKPMRQFLVIALLCFSTIYAAASDAKATKDLSTLPAAAQSTISAALGRDLPDYHIRTTSTGLEATNSHGALTTHFTAAGVQLTTGTLHWKMALRGYGYGNAIKSVTKATPQANQNRVEYRRGPLTEWYENGPVGLEQGFTLTEPPGKPNGKPLTILLGLSGDLTALSDGSRAGLKLADHSGKMLLRYAGLTARDADGKDLRASVEVDGNTLLLQVADANARYPLAIDPLIELAKLTSAGGAPGDDFGWSVAIDGGTVVVGATQNDGSNQQGAAYVFVESQSGWSSMTQTAKLTASDASSDALFGWSVAIGGNTIAVTARNTDTAYVFVKPANGWTDMTETAELFPPPGDFPSAWSVALQGNTAVVGVTNDGQGAAYVFVEPPAGWTNMTEPTATLTSTDTGESFFGHSVSLSGGTIVVGDSYADQYQGAAYVYVKPATGWASMTQTAKLTASDASGPDNFGFSVAISRETIIVGSPKNGLPGEAYIFVQPSGGWDNMTETAQLLSTSQVEDEFGYFVAISGNMAVVSAAFAKPQPTGYVFTKPQTGWATTSRFIAKFTNPHAEGYCVAIDAGTIVAGSVAASNAPGAAFIFGPE